MSMTKTNPATQRWRDVEDAKAELHGCTTAISGAASAFAAALNADTPVVNGDEAYELLLSIHDRQARALAKLDSLVIDGLSASRSGTPIKSPPA